MNYLWGYAGKPAKPSKDDREWAVKRLGQVMKMIAEGKSDQEIGDLIVCSRWKSLYQAMKYCPTPDEIAKCRAFYKQCKEQEELDSRQGVLFT